MWPNADDVNRLLALAEDGDRSAVDRLLDLHRDALVRMVRMRMDRAIRRRVDASDIVQEAMADANRRLSDYLNRPCLPFGIWLRRLARDRLLDARRQHRQAECRTVDREERKQSAFSDRSSVELLGQLQDPNLTPAANAIRRELQRRFRDALEQLEENDREILLLRHVERLSNSEAAQALDVTPQSASMRYLRALRRLKERIQSR